MINQDFILSQVVGGSLDAVAREMSATVTRTARSPCLLYTSPSPRDA